MPNLIDIVEVAEALESKAVFLAPDRCVVVRNRHASCRKCAEACPVDAVIAVDNVLSLDAERCISCGACTVVCPTEALIPLAPLDEDLATSVAQSVIASEGSAVFACARIASKRLGNPEKFTEVPCLARLEESLLLELAARGVSDIVLVDGVCSSCKFRACSAGIELTTVSANVLLETQGSPIRVQRTSVFPNHVLLEDHRGLLGSSRRGFFSQARSVAKDAAGKTFEAALKKDAVTPSLRDRLRMSDAGTLPQFSPTRRVHILDAMDSLGSSVVGEIETRLFGRVLIDSEACSSCGMCTVFCPTGALAKSEVTPEDGEGSFLEFSASECVQCNLCADACLKKCLEVSPVVLLEDLFDFEPRLIRLPEPPTRKGILSGLRR